MRRQARLFIDQFEPVGVEELNFRRRPGRCFWSALFVGLVIRIYFVVFTQGTYDVSIWQSHAAGVSELGLMGYYRANAEMNHPPFIALCMSWLWRFAQTTGIEFRVLLRAPFALLDIGTAFLILMILRRNRHRFLIAACYWLYPLTMIYSAYHGNTDMALPLFILLAVYFLSQDKIIRAGVLLGMSFWIKLPALATVPAFLFAVRGWRRRMQFLLAIALTGGAAYLIPLLYDPGVIYTNVFAYRGQLVQTTGGDPVWGMRIFLMDISQLSTPGQRWLYKPVLFYLQHNTAICLVLILLFSLMRRSERTFEGLALTVAGIYTILYGFSNYWSFQYFAWSIPFWFFTPMMFSLPAAILAAAYIYGLYGLACGNCWLLGEWDFVGHPHWPDYLILFRNLAILFFFFSGMVFLVKGIVAESARGYRRIRKK
ncbi:MAG: hypothetical protein AMJ79_15175 [Phycisphaerae bacterium SM23_30]|nr:MAG: hypothetical protein AMJ79_15175 [Phycisphaerae bacterium SM23_30]